MAVRNTLHFELFHSFASILSNGGRDCLTHSAPCAVRLRGKIAAAVFSPAFPAGLGKKNAHGFRRSHQRSLPQMRITHGVLGIAVPQQLLHRVKRMFRIDPQAGKNRPKIMDVYIGKPQSSQKTSISKSGLPRAWPGKSYAHPSWRGNGADNLYSLIWTVEYGVDCLIWTAPL